MRFATGSMVDHHCHGVVHRDLDRSDFEALLTEASGRPSRLGTSLFDSMIGLAVRRWCPPLLDLEPHAGADAYLARRVELGAEEVNRRLLAAAGIGDLVVDTGYVPEQICSSGQLGTYAGAGSHEVARLEVLGERLLADGVSGGDFGDRLVDALRSSPAVGAKSIAAYRVGLDLPAAKPSEQELARAVADIQPGSDGTYRIANPVLNAYLAWTAIDVGMPLQFHVAYGDSDVDLLDCDPLRLTSFLRATEDRGVPVLLLHNYPYHRNAAYLAQVFSHVFMDVGLAVHNTGALSRSVIREALELLPFGKMLYSSDAFGLAELHYLASALFRRGLSAVLESLVDDGEMTDADGERVARLIGGENARRVYGL